MPSGPQRVRLTSRSYNRMFMANTVAITPDRHGSTSGIWFRYPASQPLAVGDPSDDATFDYWVETLSI